MLLEQYITQIPIAFSYQLLAHLSSLLKIHEETAASETAGYLFQGGDRKSGLPESSHFLLTAALESLSLPLPPPATPPTHSCTLGPNINTSLNEAPCCRERNPTVLDLNPYAALYKPAVLGQVT